MPAPTFIESIGNTGYMAMGLQTNPTTPVTPGIFALLQSETLQTTYNLEMQTPIAGNYMDTFQVLPGLRGHAGDFTIVAEPNTAKPVFDMLLKQGSKTGTGPYTWPYTLDNPSNSYTIDIPVGSGLVKRFWGVMSEGVSPSFSKNQLNLKSTVSALGSFQGRKLSAAPTGTGTFSVVLDTAYTPTPTLGLVAGDLIRFYTAASATIDATVSAVTNGTTFTTSVDVTSFAADDFVYLRQQTTSYTLLSPFLWSNTQFCFGADATTALSATQTRVEQGSTFSLAWPFESKDGSPRSGNADPASLVRLTAQPTLTIKKFFGNPQDIENFNQLTKTACVIRCYAYVGAVTYELRVTFNHIKTDSPTPSITAKQVNYSNIKYIPQYDQTDGVGFGITIINGLAA